MRNVIIACVIVVVGLLACPVQADIFMGNGGTGFGDVLGNGTLEVTASGSTINGTLTHCFVC